MNSKKVAACGGLGTEVGEELGTGYRTGSEFVECFGCGTASVVAFAEFSVLVEGPMVVA